MFAALHDGIRNHTSLRQEWVVFRKPPGLSMKLTPHTEKEL
jgi:hypothetical protein